MSADGCLCGGTDNGVGIQHEPHCPLSGKRCQACRGHGQLVGTDEWEDMIIQILCTECDGTCVRSDNL